MTVKKSLKRRVRARMSKTGERYTAARRHVVAKADSKPESAPEPAAVVPAAPAAPAAMAAASPGMSDAAIRRGTGKGWDEWFALLDEWGAAERTHTEIAAWLNEVQGLDGWWAQGVTVGYERARGRRAVGQLVDGFSSSASKTVAVPVERLYEAFTNARLRARWLTDAPFVVTTATPSKSVNARWEDATTTVPAAKGATRGSRIAIGLTAKGASKSQVAIQHSRLRDAQAAEQMKAYWRERLAALQRLLER